MKNARFSFAAVLILLGGCTADTPAAPDAHGLPIAAHSGDVRTGYVLGGRGQPVEITYEVRNGLAIREGDVVIGHADSIAATPDALKRNAGARFGVIVNDQLRWWPKGEVPYIISTTVTYPQRVRDAIAIVEASAPGVDFILIPESQTSGTSFVRFIWQSTASCDSPIGKQGGPQYVYLGDACSVSNIVHEITHALGMQHEHTRCNRSDFVEILTENVLPGKLHNFNPNCNFYHMDVGQYSESSIMHYPANAWSANGKPTIRSKFGREYLMGSQTYSASDITTLSFMYPGQVQVHRWYNPALAGGDHLYSLSSTEGTAHGYTLEDRDYFHLSSATSSQYVKLYRCLVNNHHFLSRDQYCEAGIRAEGPVGSAASWQMEKTVPLYRTRNPQTGDRLATTSAAERSATLSWGWTNEGILGYVWPGS